jgi:hypothetical protein
MAKGLFQQAQSSIESARQALRDGHWAYAVRTSQDASELSLKALLLSAGTDPPKVHNLSHALKENKDRLGKMGFRGGEVEEMAKMAAGLAENRSKALYGDEKRDIPASKLYEQDDADSALRAAEDVHQRCRDAAEKRF